VLLDAGAVLLVNEQAGALPPVPTTKPDGDETPTLASDAVWSPVGPLHDVPANGVVQITNSKPPAAVPVVTVNVQVDVPELTLLDKLSERDVS
jgi:hypothetical protein